jgi:hypothetical protein
MPLQFDRYHLDVALLLTSLACSRGLSDTTSDQVFTEGARIIPQLPDTSEQAVFV